MSPPALRALAAVLVGVQLVTLCPRSARAETEGVADAGAPEGGAQEGGAPGAAAPAPAPTTADAGAPAPLLNAPTARAWPGPAETRGAAAVPSGGRSSGGDAQAVSWKRDGSWGWFVVASSVFFGSALTGAGLAQSCQEGSVACPRAAGLAIWGGIGVASIGTVLGLIVVSKGRRPAPPPPTAFRPALAPCPVSAATPGASSGASELH